MPFEDVERADAAKDFPVAVSFKGGRGSERRPQLRVTMLGVLVERCGWKTGEAVGLQVGSGEHSGRIRLVRGSSRPVGKLFETPRGKALVLSCGHIVALGMEERGRMRVPAEVTGPDAIEIDLRGWDSSVEGGEGDEEEEVAAAPRHPLPTLPHKGGGLRPANGEAGKPFVDLGADIESITFRGETMELTARQAALAAALVVAMPNPVGRPQLIARVWNGSAPGSADLLLGQAAGDLDKAVKSLGLQVATIKGIGICMREAA